MPTIYRTEQASVLWTPETTFGVRPTNPTWEQFGIHDTLEAPDPEIAFEPFWQVGTNRNRKQMLRGKWSMKGRVPDIRVVPNLALKVLALPIGRNTGTGVREGRALSGSAVDERIDSLTLQVGVRDTSGGYFIREWYGGKINRASLSMTEGEDLRLSLEDVIFKNVAHNQNTFQGTSIEKYSASVGSTPGSPSTTFSENRYVFAGASMVFFGQTLARIKSASLTIDNSIEERYYWRQEATSTSATQVVSDLIEGRRVYSMSVEMDLADPTTDLVMYQWLLNQSASAGADSPTTGGQIVMTFNPIYGEAENVSGVGAMTIYAGISPSGQEAFNPGSVITGGRISIPSLGSSGLLTSNWTIDVNSIQIDMA